MRKRMIPAAVAALALVGALAVTQIAAADPARHDTGRLDTEALQARLDDFAGLTAGSVLIEVRDGDDTWTEAAGLRSLDEDARRARPGDRVRIGSVTKSMVAAVVLQLDGEGVPTSTRPSPTTSPASCPTSGSRRSDSSSATPPASPTGSRSPTPAWRTGT
jgi:D-alanyl-D-alanine carboxypeptidase